MPVSVGKLRQRTRSEAKGLGGTTEITRKQGQRAGAKKSTYKRGDRLLFVYLFRFFCWEGGISDRTNVLSDLNSSRVNISQTNITANKWGKKKNSCRNHEDMFQFSTET